MFVDGHRTFNTPHGRAVFEKMDRDETIYLNTAWHWRYAGDMKSCGAEMGCIGSCKIMFEGARILLLAPFNELE